MPQQPPNPAIVNSPTDSGFVPRKEFVRDNKPAPNFFAIVAVAGSNLVRLYSFPPSAISNLRTLFEGHGLLTAYREDVQQNLCEFVLDGKPFSSPKSVRTEKLLIDILAVIYHSGYTYLSSLDYGRENDDRLAMAFCKPSTSPAASRSGTPLPASASPFRDSSASISSDKPKDRRIPFALSFISPTVMRVIAPPLHLTPAILQAVRASWPRGVVSEKKVGENSYEFKLKGYKWFQQDTFATDSLRHILALLSSLDNHSFTLLSSLSLTNRSRVKDLWVFTGPGSSPSTDELLRQESASPSGLNGSQVSHGEIKRRSPEYPPKQHTGPITQHRRLATEPIGSVAHPHPHQHARAATEENSGFQVTHGYREDHFAADSPSLIPQSAGLLRKPAPRAQVPVSVIHETDAPDMEAIRANLPSTISSGVEDMTGVGAAGFSPDVFYSTSPFGYSEASATPISSPIPVPAQPTPKRRSVTPPNRPRSPLRPVSTRSKTPPLLTSNPSPPRPHPATRQSSSQLLGPGAFRDTAFSSSSDSSAFDIPIKWTGIGETLAQEQPPKSPESEIPRSPISNRASSISPVLPGAWQPTPIEEKPEDTGGVMDERPASTNSEVKNSGPKTPIHEVASRMASPELTRPDMPLRKSEAVLVGLISETAPPPLPTAARSTGLDSPSSGTGQGWVLVNVDGVGGAPQGDTPATDSSLAIAAGGSEQPMPPPQAKAIVIMDSVETKSKTRASTQESTETISSTKKRFFGLGRKSSKKASTPTPQSNGDSSDPPKGSTLTKSRSVFRNRLKLMGTPEAARNEDKRRSMD